MKPNVYKSMNFLSYWSYRIRRAKNKPFKEIFTFGLKRTKFMFIYFKNRLKLFLNIPLPASTHSFFDNLQIENLKIKTDKEEYILEYFLKRKDINFFFNLEDVSIKKEYINNFHFEYEKLIALSNDYINKRFYLLGLSYEFANEINWHTDFNGNRWPLIYYASINYFHNDRDIKLTWELNRHHHLTILGLAYFLSKDEKYAKEVYGQINDWVAKNPYLIGVNWAEGIEVSIRTFSWIFTYFLILKSENLTPQFNLKILRNIYLNGKFLREFLSDKWIINNNHIIAELSGLLLISVLFPEFKESRNWMKFCFNTLEKELEKQVMLDGVLWEHSTGYHKFVTEMLLYPIILARINGYEIPKKILETLEKMLDFLNYISMDNGKIPIIGDEDQGFMLNLNGWDYDDIIGISTIGSALFGRLDWISNKSEIAFWLLNRFIPPNIKKTYGYPSFKVFEESGYSVLKSKKDYLLFITCARNKKYLHAGHRHVDMLSFIYEYDGEYFVVDNGTYIYNGNDEARNLFRSIWMHNTVTIDGKNPCELTPFEMNPRPRTEILKYGEHEKLNYVWARHNGYHPLEHNRIVMALENGYVLYDWVKGDGENHVFESYVHLHPDVKIIKISKKQVELEKNKKLINITFSHDLESINSKFSPRYGVIMDSKALKIKCEAKDYTAFIGISNSSQINFEDVIDIMKEGVIKNG